MATTTTLLQHPLHKQHPLKPQDFTNDSFTPRCYLCKWKISSDGYACEECKFYAHRVCAEAPPRIDPHPLHTDHPLTLIHQRPSFSCDACDQSSIYHNTSSFRCDDCDFNLDIRCALSTLSDPEQINLPFHHHLLSSFSTRHDFILDGNCMICKASVQGDGYTCFHWECEFIIHKRCVPDLYYTDGTKAPQVYHRHPLETFLGEDTGKRTCVKCACETSSREFIGCVRCKVFIHRDCVKVPEIIQYPHHPDHTLVLLIICLNNHEPLCDSCSKSLEGELCYGCPSCEFFVDVECALQVLSYCDEGMSTEIKLSWHEHPLLLCHGTKNVSNCSYCEDKAAGPMYTCKEEGCEILFHKRCTEIEVPAILQHPHHPNHPLTLCQQTDLRRCEACFETIFHLHFSCKPCAVNLHAKCAARFPTRKHPLHEHELLHLKEAPFWNCNRPFWKCNRPFWKCNCCGTSTSSPFFRCVPCDFNRHEVCMELPLQVVKSEVHWDPLTLHETYIEDDTGEYYCDKCEKSRDIRLGAYVCLQCIQRWVYHIECVFPKLRKVCGKEENAAEIERLADDIARREEEVRKEEIKLEEIERKLEEMKRELDEQRKKHAALTFHFEIRRDSD